MAALLIGTALAIGALGFVLYPLFFGGQASPSTPAPRPAPENLALIALREIEFDHVTGKLSDADYAQLKASYSREALAMMRARPVEAPAQSRATAVDDEAIETAIRSFRKATAGCSSCGPRPESDALFCSNCGRYLNDRCAACGTPVEALDARYCVNCGRRLAA